MNSRFFLAYLSMSLFLVCSC